MQLPMQSRIKTIEKKVQGNFYNYKLPIQNRRFISKTTTSFRLMVIKSALMCD